MIGQAKESRCDEVVLELEEEVVDGAAFGGFAVGMYTICPR